MRRISIQVTVSGEVSPDGLRAEASRMGWTKSGIDRYCDVYTFRNRHLLIPRTEDLGDFNILVNDAMRVIARVSGRRIQDVFDSVEGSSKELDQRSRP